MTAINLKKCRVAASGNIITPKGRLGYVQYVFEGQEQEDKKTKKLVKKYTCNIAFPPDADFTELKNKMGKIALEQLNGDKTRAKNMVEKRFLDPHNLPNGGKPWDNSFKGWKLLRSTSKDRPDFYYPNGSKIPDDKVEDELYSGRYACITVNPYWSKNSENPGVFIGLQNVQLLDHAENIGRAKAKDEFESVDVEGSNEVDSSTSEDDVDDMFN